MEFLKVVPYLSGAPGVGQKVRPFSRAVTLCLVSVTFERLKTVG